VMVVSMDMHAVARVMAWRSGTDVTGEESGGFSYFGQCCGIPLTMVARNI
jgi:hypothetical protein